MSSALKERKLFGMKFTPVIKSLSLCNTYLCMCYVHAHVLTKVSFFFRGLWGRKILKCFIFIFFLLKTLQSSYHRPYFYLQYVLLNVILSKTSLSKALFLSYNCNLFVVESLITWKTARSLPTLTRTCSLDTSYSIFCSLPTYHIPFVAYLHFFPPHIFHLPFSPY